MSKWKQDLLDRHKPYVWAGIDCDEGWRPLVEAFYALADKHPCVVVAQVKEKYGTLRLYWDHDHEKCQQLYWDKEAQSMTLRDPEKHYSQLQGLVDGLDYASGFVCELCGKFGRVRGGSWVRTLCDEHASE